MPHDITTIEVETSDVSLIEVDGNIALAVADGSTIVLTSGSGPPGNTGATGPSGGLYHYHNQVVPSSSVTVTHGFGQRPNVTVIVGGIEVETDVEHVDLNNVHFTFPSPTAFEAIFVG